MAINLSPSTVRELRTIIDQHTSAPVAPPAAPPSLDFCTVWPEAKPILQALAGVAGFIPGPGAAAGPILTALVSVGDTIFKQTCTVGTP